MERKSDPKYDAYKAEFARQNYDTIKLYVPKGKREEIREFAAARGESLNSFVIRLIDEAMKKGAKK